MFHPCSNDYDFPPYRPPNEASSALIRASRGCPWNRCLFCTMYKELKFRAKPVDEVKRDIDKAAELFRGCDTIFMADSDSLAMKDIAGIIRYTRLKLPDARRMTSYARARTLMRLGVEKLTRIRKAGLTRVHIGLESGDDTTLEFMDKGATARQMIDGGRAAMEAGLEVSFYVLVGAGGQERLEEHARESAKVCNAVDPDFIRLRTLVVQEGSLLEQKKMSGEYRVTTPLQKLREVRMFLEDLEVTDCYLASDHLTNCIWAENRMIYRGVEGKLPSDKKEMLSVLDSAISVIEGMDEKDGDVLDATILAERGCIDHL